MEEPDEDVVRAAALLLSYTDAVECRWNPSCGKPATGQIVLPAGMTLDGQKEVNACSECLRWARRHRQDCEVVGWMEDE